MQNNEANPGRPAGDGGREMLERMNGGAHEALATWGLQYLEVEKDSNVLDIGCGGGANIARLLKMCPDGHVTGVDYSEVSVEVSSKTNEDAIRVGRASVCQGNVLALPFEDERFDAVTAFETIYFWPEIENSFKQVHRVLKSGGQFFICNETDGNDPEGYEWEKNIDNLKIYKTQEIVDLLNKAGFGKVDVKPCEGDNAWVCFIAKKN